MDSETQLIIQILGPIRLTYGDGSVEILRRQARALLYLLAVDLSLISREELCFLYWPNRAEADGRRHLSLLLSHLRRELPPDTLVTEREQVGMNPNRVYTDAAHFQRMCADLTPNTPPRTLQQAADLYQGPLLAGFSMTECPELDNWIAQRRRQLERLYLSLLTTQVSALSVREEYRAAVECAQRYLEIDNLAELIHRQLMELYTRVGNRSAAIHQYEICVELLQEQLGVGPLPETEALYRALLQGTEIAPPRATTTPLWSTLPSLDLPLIAREGELKRLNQALSQAQKGQGSLILIEGESGMGKSRLMQEFATAAQDRALVLAGGCHSALQEMPYHPLVEALRLALNTPHVAIETQAVWLAEAAVLLPELADKLPNGAAPMATEPGQTRTRLFEALLRLLLGLDGGRRPQLLCLDDLQWADATTLDWLIYMGRTLRRSRLLVVGTYRNDEMPRLQELRQTLTRLDVLSILRLAELETASIAAMIAQLDSRYRPHPETAARLRQMSGGNPFYILELLTSQLEAGGRSGFEPAGAALVIPPTLQQLLNERLSQISPRARRTLDACAILGLSVKLEIVALTVGQDELDALLDLEELVDHRILQEQVEYYQFGHSLFQSVAYQVMGHGRRRLLHRRAGEVLEDAQRALEQSRASPHQRMEIATQLANHFEQAGVLEKAILYHLQAGSGAREISAYDEAIGHFERGLFLLKGLPGSRALLNLELQLHAAMGPARIALRGYGAPEIGLLYLRARELCGQVGDTPQLIPVLMGLAAYYLVRADLSAVIVLLKQIIHLAQGAQSTAGVLAAHLGLGISYSFAGKPRAAVQHLRWAIGLYEPELHGWLIPALGYDPGITGRAYLANSLWLLGFADQARAEMRTALDLSEQTSSALIRNGVLHLDAVLCHYLRQPAATHSRSQAVMQSAAERSFPHQLALATILHAWAAAAQGHPDQAGIRITNSIGQLQESGTMLAMTYFHLLLAEAYAWESDPHNGLETVNAALVQAEISGEHNWDAELFRRRGELLLLQSAQAERESEGHIGDAEMEAESCFQRALSVARQQFARSWELRAATSMSRLWQRQGKYMAAYRLLIHTVSQFREGLDTQDMQDAMALIDQLVEQLATPA